MSLFDKINADIKTAMLAREKDKLEPLRAVKAAFLMARTEKGASDNLSEDAEIKIIQRLVKQRKDSAEIYKTNNREELYTKEVFEANLIAQYLPAQLSDSEIEEEVRSIITKVGATGPQDMGKVMGMASKQMAGKAEGKMISTVVKTVLSSL